MKRFKKLVVLFLAVSVSLVSCEGDDANTAALEGKWQFSKEGEIVNGQEVLETYEHEAGCTKDFLDFKAGGIFNDHYFEITEATCTEYLDTGTWSRNGNQLTISGEEGSQIVTIVELTTTTFKIKVEDEDDIYLYVLTRI